MFLDPRIRRLDEFHVCEWEMADFAVEFTLPLAIDRHLGDFDHITHFESESRLVISIGNSSLFYSGKGG